MPGTQGCLGVDRRRHELGAGGIGGRQPGGLSGGEVEGLSRSPPTRGPGRSPGDLEGGLLDHRGGQQAPPGRVQGVGVGESILVGLASAVELGQADRGQCGERQRRAQQR